MNTKASLSSNSRRKVAAGGVRRVVIWGAGGHATVVADIIRLLPECGIAGFLDAANPGRWNTDFCGALILGGEAAAESAYESGIRHAVIAIGSCQARLRAAETARRIGFELFSAVHPRAIVARTASIGAGSVVCAGAVVNPGAFIGENVIINTSSSVDHDCVIEDGAHICPGVHLAGNVRVGKGTWVGIGTVVKEKVSIGAACTIGAGSVILKDLPDEVTAYGVPARIVPVKK